MENICEPNESFNFIDMSLAHPTSIQGGAYFTKILQNNKSLYIEAPKCLTKQGFVKNGKKMYTDLMFDNNDEGFIHWIENLEVTCQNLIYDKSDTWFQNKLEMSDIETAFTSPMRVYKSGKYYIVRVNVKMNYSTNFPNIKIYNESETPLTIDDVNLETQIISIIEVQGIRFTSRNFQIELELKQVMVLNTDKIFENCLIKTMSVNKNVTPENKLPFKIENNTQNNLIQNSLTQDNSLEEMDNNVNDNINDKIDDNILDNHLLINKNVDVDVDVVSPASLSLLEKLSDSILSSEEEHNAISNSMITTTTNHVDTNTIDINLTTTIDQNNNKVATNVTDASIIIDELKINDLCLEKSDQLQEVDINTMINGLETITLKKPNQVYYEIYKAARKKAKKAKRDAVVAFLEAKNIKKTYMLDDLDESDNSDNSDDSDESEDEEDGEVINLNNSRESEPEFEKI